MIIDCHTHLGRNEHIMAGVNGLLHSMDEANIDKSLVFAGELNAYPTDVMLQEIKPHRDRLYGVASWDFEYRYKHRDADMFEQEDTLVRLYEAKEIVAVKFYVGYYHKMPSECGEILWRLNQIGCPAIFHCGDCLNSVKCAKLKYSHPLNIDEVAVDYPNMNFIIAHMGYPWHRDAAEVCYKNDNVYADISGFVYGNFSENDSKKFKKVLEEFMEISSTEKLLFGTDWPISNQKSYLDTLASYNDGSIYGTALTQNVKRAFKLHDV
jgi:predicted TIM-barrel fold metal-dependent hydrolase